MAHPSNPGATPIAPLPDTRELRQKVLETCFLMRDSLGFFIGTWGNISVRVEDGLLVTPTRANYEELQLEDLPVVSWEGVKLRGSKLPTSETELHRQIYLARPDFGALIHHHAPWSAAFACARQPIPVVSDDMAMVVGGPVQCAPYVPAGRHHELAKAVRETIGPDAQAVLMSNHGTICGGRDLDEATLCCQFVEKAAQVFIQAKALGGAFPLTESQWREERDHYVSRYGRAADLRGVVREKPGF
jgi:L-fuculose-phosphate aldolase